MRRVLMNFQQYQGLWHVHFIERDCKTTIGAETRYYHFATLDGLRIFVNRCHPLNMADFEHCIRAWNKGSTWCDLTDEQYSKLR